MRHAIFQNKRPSGSEEKDFFKVFAIYSQGGHLGHLTCTIYNTNFQSTLLKLVHIKFGFVWPSGFSEDV